MSEGVVAVQPARLRKAEAADAAAVGALLEAVGLPTDGVAAQLGESYEVAEDGGAVVGVAGLELHGRYALLRSVAVRPELQGTGVGAALVAARLRQAHRTGVDAVYLLTTTAAPWFTRFGFRRVERADVPEEIQRTAEFSSLCPSTAVVMALHASAAVPDSDGPSALKAVVQERYGAAARAAAAGGRACCGGEEAPMEGIAQRSRGSCCGGSAPVVEQKKASCCGGDGRRDPITDDLYEAAQVEGLPAEAMLASLGCGNPTALAQLEPGETVLDLGSGGGIDVLLSARRVGPTGKAYGLDMTDDMLELARANQARAGVANVEFLKGDIESIPLPDESVDVIISNCVINLSADKAQVLREAFRVLRPGGRFAVSDVVARKDVPASIRRSQELWVGCVAGALHEREYAALLADAGFEEIGLEPTRIYGGADAGELLADAGVADAAVTDSLDGAFMSAFIRARKPRY